MKAVLSRQQRDRHARRMEQLATIERNKRAPTKKKTKSKFEDEYDLSSSSEKDEAHLSSSSSPKPIERNKQAPTKKKTRSKFEDEYDLSSSSEEDEAHLSSSSSSPVPSPRANDDGIFNPDMYADAAALDQAILSLHGMTPITLEHLARVDTMGDFLEALCDPTKRLSWNDSFLDEDDGEITSILRTDIDGALLRTRNPMLPVVEQVNSIFAWLLDPEVSHPDFMVRGAKPSSRYVLWNGTTLTTYMGFGPNNNMFELVIKMRSNKSRLLMNELYNSFHSGDFVCEVFNRMAAYDRGFAPHLMPVTSKLWVKCFTPIMWVTAVRDTLNGILTRLIAPSGDRLDQHVLYVESNVAVVSGGSRTDCASKVVSALRLALGGGTKLESKYTSLVMDFACTEQKRCRDHHDPGSPQVADDFGIISQKHVVKQPFIQHHAQPLMFDQPDNFYVCLPAFGGDLEPSVIQGATILNPEKRAGISKAMANKTLTWFGLYGSVDQTSGSLYKGSCTSSYTENQLLIPMLGDLQHLVENSAAQSRVKREADLNLDDLLFPDSSDSEEDDLEGVDEAAAARNVNIDVEVEKVYNSLYHVMSGGNVEDALKPFKDHDMVGCFCLPTSLVTSDVLDRMTVMFALNDSAEGLAQQMDLSYMLDSRSVSDLGSLVPAIQMVVGRCEVGLRLRTDYKENPDIYRHNLEKQKMSGKERAKANQKRRSSWVRGGVIHDDGDEEARAYQEANNWFAASGPGKLNPMEKDQHALEPKGVRHEVRFVFRPSSIHDPEDIKSVFQSFHQNVTARHRTVFSWDLIRYIRYMSHFVSSFVQCAAARFVYMHKYRPSAVQASPMPVSVILGLIRLLDEYAYFIMGSVSAFHTDFWMSDYTICTDMLEQCRLSGRPFSNYFEWFPQLDVEDSALWVDMPALDFEQINCVTLKSPQSHMHCGMFQYAKAWLDDRALTKNQHNIQLETLQRCYDDFVVQDVGATSLLFDRVQTNLTLNPPKRVLVPGDHPRNRPGGEHFTYMQEVHERLYAAVHANDSEVTEDDFEELALVLIKQLGEEYCDRFTATARSPRGGRNMAQDLVNKFTKLYEDTYQEDPTCYFRPRLWYTLMPAAGGAGKYHTPPKMTFVDLMLRICFASHPDTFLQWKESKLRMTLARSQPRFQLVGYNDQRFIDGLRAARATLFGDDPLVIHRVPSKGPKKITKNKEFWVFNHNN
jgi:hypothetical protein